MEIWLPTSGWAPRPYQRPLWGYLERGGKRAVAVWHRRAGKDEVALHRTAVAAFERVGTYWHMLPEAAQARKAIWEAVNPHSGKRRIDEAFPVELRETVRDTEMFIRFVNGSTWQVVGSDNFNSLIGAPPIGIVFSEWSLANPQAWAYLRPILAENGGWALFIYTSRGRNHGATTYDLSQSESEWFGEKLPAQKTGVFTADALERERREYVADYGETVGRSLFRQEYECSFDAPILGAYFGADIEKAENEERVRPVPWTPALPVVTAWDLGMDDATAIWFVQFAGQEVRLIDYLEGNGEALHWYVARLRERPYVYGEHLLPHDAEVRELGTGTSRVETLQSLGLSGVRVVPRQNVADGVNAARLLLPRCWFEATKTKRGIEALRNYRAEWDAERKVLRSTPVHDWASHGADAFRYLALGLRTTKQAKAPENDLRYII